MIGAVQKLGLLAASLAIHAGLVVLAVTVSVRTIGAPRVIFAELMPLEGPPPPPPPRLVEAPRPAPPKPKRLTLPKPIETLLPKLDEDKPTEPPPPVAPPVARVEPTPPSAAPSPISTVAVTTPAATGPTVPAGTPVARGNDTFALTSAPPGALSSAAPAARPVTESPVPPSTALAVPPGDGVTAVAIPRGGYQVRPSYPSSARALGIQGTTLLRVFVAADGRVTDVGVEKSAGHPDLDHAAADAVRRWRFEPARRGTEPVGMWVRLPVEFRLR